MKQFQFYQKILVFEIVCKLKCKLQNSHIIKAITLRRLKFPINKTNNSHLIIIKICNIVKTTNLLENS